ncbi:MAG: hypothetical protein R3F55_04865 [Alphaproteobacteria bacterium]
MTRRLIASALLSLAVATTAVPPIATAQDDTAALALNAVSTAPTTQNSWRLTLEFGRADRSATANARSVRAPSLAVHEVEILGPDGRAAPFIVHAVGSPDGNKLTVMVEYFGPAPLVDSDRYALRIVGEDSVAADRAEVAFDSLPPALVSPAGG